MTETPGTPEPAPTPPPEPTKPSAEPAPSVPTDRSEQNVLAEAKRKQTAAEKEAADLRKRVDELEDRDRSDLEKALKRAERAEQQAVEFEQRTKRLERGGWVRTAANREGFNDPDDAVAFTDLEDVTDEREAERLVKQLAKRKPHLLKPSEPERPQIGRILQDGQPAQPTAQKGPSLAEQDSAAVVEELKKIGVL